MANRCGCNDPEVDIAAGDSARMVALWHTKYLHDKARLSVKNCDNCLCSSQETDCGPIDQSIFLEQQKKIILANDIKRLQYGAVDSSFNLSNDKAKILNTGITNGIALHPPLPINGHACIPNISYMSNYIAHMRATQYGPHFMKWFCPH
jgi:hypothetical protein